MSAATDKGVLDGLFDMPRLDAVLNRVNALPLLRALAGDCRAHGDADVADGIDKLISAVAELIEAAKSVERQPALDDATFMVNRPGVTLALIRLRTALARCNGEGA